MLLGLFCCDTQVETQPTPTPESRTGIEGSIVLHNIQAGPTREGVPDSKPLGKMTFGDFPRGGFFAWLLSYVFSFCAGCQVHHAIPGEGTAAETEIRGQKSVVRRR